MLHRDPTGENKDSHEFHESQALDSRDCASLKDARRCGDSGAEERIFQTGPYVFSVRAGMAR